MLNPSCDDSENDHFQHDKRQKIKNSGGPAPACLLSALTLGERASSCHVWTTSPATKSAALYLGTTPVIAKA